MTARRSIGSRLTRWMGQGAIFLGFSAGVLVLLLWLGGTFQPKVPMNAPVAAAGRQIQGTPVPARFRTLERTEAAVGTIRAVHETSIGSKLLARVTEVRLKAGQSVRKDDVLIRLDATDLQAKLQQAKAALTAAEAVREQAVTDEKRFGQLIRTNSISQQEYEKASTALRSAEAELIRAQQAVREVEATLDWATIRSPMDGLVIDKKVDVGDMVSPGQVLVTLFDPTRMQLVASVRESLANRLQPGQTIGVAVPSLDKQCSGTISEIVPETQSSSRAFLVKVTGPCPRSVHSGMFGRLAIPLEQEQVLVIPAKAVRRVGQLELVQMAVDGQAVTRAIRTGRSIDDDVEVLSGLSEGDRVVVVGRAATVQEASHE